MAGAEQEMCARGSSWLWEKERHLTYQSEKYLPSCVGSEYREICCTLAHFAGRVLSLMKGMKLSKVIPRRMRNEANKT